jgi:hypothetical protein
MSTQAQPNVVIIGTPKRIDSPSKFSIYCSAAEILLSGWDVRINFMENVPPQEGNPIAIVHGSVVMSPVHAKGFLMGLSKAISQYEELFGELDAQKVLDVQNAASSTVTPNSE